ncbi:MAG: serine hydrolase domain-containing protein, partial [Alphaproteobacteria bacterium]
WAAGRIEVVHDDAERRITVTWRDPAFGPDVVGRAIAQPGYGGIVLGAMEAPTFDPAPIPRAPATRSAAWPVGDGGIPAGARPASAELEETIDRLFAASPGIYGLLVATPEGVVIERYSAHGAADRPTPSWSMTKAITGTIIARMLHLGWLGSVHDPAPAPLWRDPRAIHRTITIDHLLRMRSGLGYPAVDGTADGSGEAAIFFENNFVYYNAEDAFETAQRAIVATVPGSVYRYINTGVNVLGAIIRDRIEARGLPYHETVYRLLADAIGMSSYQHSADCKGNFVASGSGAAVARDYARFGLLYVQDGVWNGERLLPEGWVDYALNPVHTGQPYAACFRTNADLVFPSLPRSAAWASGASDQRVIILHEHRLVIVATNETDHPMDLGALDRVGAAAIASRRPALRAAS